MSHGGTRDPEVIESGPAPRLLGARLRERLLTFGRRVLAWRVLLGVALLAAITTVAVAAQQYRQRLAAEDRVSLTTGSDTAVSVDLSTRTLLLDLVIDNRGRYPVTLVGISVMTPGLSVVPGRAGNDGAPAVLPAKVGNGQTLGTTLILRPDCAHRLPSPPQFRLAVTSSRGRRHVRVLPPFAPLSELWAESVKSACFDKPE